MCFSVSAVRQRENKVYNNTFYIDSVRRTSYLTQRSSTISLWRLEMLPCRCRIPNSAFFEANCYGGGWAVRPNDPAAVTEDPLFVSAGGEAVDEAA